MKDNTMTYNVDALLEQRSAKDAFATSDHSPLPPEAREKFNGLRYFDPNPDLCFEGEVILIDDDEEILIQKTLGDPIAAKRFGYFSFEVDDTQAQLTVFDVPNEGLGITFKDATSGKETYGGGRFVPIEALDNGMYRIDFNRAANPVCAYVSNYSCPIPPKENILSVAIRAGEMTPDDAWVTA